MGKGKWSIKTRDAHWVDSDSGALGQRRFLDLGECCSAKCQMLFSGELSCVLMRGLFAKVFLGSDSEGSLFPESPPLSE